MSSANCKLPVTAVLAGYAGIFIGGLGLKLGLRRAGENCLYGLGKDSEDWQHKIRGHQNATEYFPTFIAMIAALEANKMLAQPQLAALAGVFAVARSLHTLQLSEPKSIPLPVRVMSFLTQVGCFVAAGGILITKGIKALKK